MAKKPDTPCGGCGKLLWSGSSSLPPGQRRCRACRGGRQPQPTSCLACGTVFTTRDARLCSKTCRAAYRRGKPAQATVRRCADCGLLKSVQASVRSCADCFLARRRAHWRRKNAVRRGAVRVGRQISIAQLGDRDAWRCHLCLRKVDRALACPDPMSPTFDHLVPISDGGTDEPANVRLAHRFCNTSRGTGGVVQLMLVG